MTTANRSVGKQKARQKRDREPLPLGVEVLSDDLLERPTDELARTTAEATQRVVEGARTHQ